MIALGYTTIPSLKGQNPEALYREDCTRKGYQEDRCQLYVFRYAVYFAKTKQPDPEELKWWYRKDQKPEQLPS